MICEFARIEYLLNPCPRLDTRLHPGLDLELGSRLEYKYSVTQLPPGDYGCVKWWYDGPVLQAEPRKSSRSVKS